MLIKTFGNCSEYFLALKIFLIPNSVYQIDMSVGNYFLSPLFRFEGIRSDCSVLHNRHVYTQILTKIIIIYWLCFVYFIPALNAVYHQYKHIENRNI